MLFAFTPEDLERLAGPIGIVVGVLAMLLNPQMRALLFKGQPPPPRSRYPTSSVCPSCGANDYKAVEPETAIAFVRDRICKACATRYTPPTPSWAAALFVALGVFLLGLVIYSAITNLMRVIFTGILAHLFEAVVGLCAVAVIAFGIRVFRESVHKSEA